MGIFQDKILKPLLKNMINEEIAKAQLPDLAKSASVNESQAGVYSVYPFAGMGRRKDRASIDFDSLRAFSVSYDVVRACINHRKRQIDNLEWAIIPKDPKADPKKYKRQIDEITALFSQPFHNIEFKDFVDKMIEDLLVLDAAVLWKDKTYGGDLTGLLNVDGATIRLKLHEDGTTPEPPDIAYVQMIMGEIAGEYDTDEMYYKMMNPRTNTPYGLSPLESLIISVDTAMRSQIANNQMLSEGSVPEGFFGLPPEWTPDQVKEFQVWFDSLMAGGQATSRIKFMPGGKGVGYIPTKKPDDMRYLELEKWLLVKTCAVFDVQPKDIGFMENVTVSTGETQKQSSMERGLIPMANFLKSLFNAIIRNDFDNMDLKFEWKGLQVIDDSFELERSKTMLQNGAMTIDEWRATQGLDPYGLPATQTPWILTAGGPVYLNMEVNDEMNGTGDDTPGADDNNADDNGDNPKDDASQQLQEMVKWETKCVNYLKDNKGLPQFVAQKLDKEVVALINVSLQIAKNKDDVKNIFKPFKDILREESLVSKTIKLNRDIAKHKITKYERIGQPTKQTQ